MIDRLRFGPRSVLNRLQFALADRRIREQIERVEAWLHEQASPSDGAPVLFFNASTRLYHLSLNGAFSLLASWAVRQAGAPVRYLVCHRGMEQCVLGTNVADLSQPPPCNRCIRYSDGLFPSELTLPLELDATTEEALGPQLAEASLAELSGWVHRGLPLGELCLPGLRWALRRHDLSDDPATRRLYRRYLRSAASLAARLEGVLDKLAPQALVVFNGVMYPEAVARELALRRDIPVVTHEVGLKPNSAFFSHKHATFREVEPRPLLPEEGAELDGYLEARRAGKFSMAGIRFWPEVRPLPDRIAAQLQDGRQLVTVFTNVVFDTSQVHANALYGDMFEWLDDLAGVIRSHPDTLFVIRAHPDEDRPGKASRQSVADWVERSRLSDEPNVYFLAPQEYASSYALIERSKFITIYNSSVGLEAAIMGVPVLCGGRARFTQSDTVTFPGSAAAYRRTLEQWLGADELQVDERLRANSRAFLYHELNHASLDLSEFLNPYPIVPGMIEFSDFEPEQLARSAELTVIRRGILHGEPFEHSATPEVQPA